VHVKHANPDTPEPSVESFKSSLGSTQKQLESASTHLKKLGAKFRHWKKSAEACIQPFVLKDIKLSALQLKSFCWKNRSSF
jgi:hypothetical protein